MNARTCLLCGKPLSRIWVGAGEDFCSREHRNQYRLRRGMDRLQEANKVANLMRRRENPKPIPAPEPTGDINARLADSSQIRFSPRSFTSVLPTSKWVPPVRIPGGRSWISRYPSGTSQSEPRHAGLPRHAAARLIFKKERRRITEPGANYLERIRQPRPLPADLHGGDALKVSAGAGFRVSKARAQALRLNTHRPSMRWPDQVRPGELPWVDSFTDYSVPRIRFRPPELQTPESPRSTRAAAMAYKGAIDFGKRLIACDTDPAARACGELWTNWDSAMPRPIRHSGQHIVQPQFVALPQQSAAGAPTPHLVLVPILPEDRAFNYIPAIVVSPARLSGVPLEKLEEQFDAGLTRWTGGIGDWILDPAGARTGSLAIFTPTIDKRDYEFEFLARIDHQSVNWVFRAADLNDYYLASIILMPDGSYQFKRGCVMGDAREFADPITLQMPLNRKNAVTIKLHAVGTEFSVSLDGQVIDTWSDNLLSTGGIGFVGAPDDRARIYWVRLTPAGSPGKEYSRR
jgi:hypothetical protein